MHTMKTALTIAGSDPSGGAGIQADLKTMTVCGVYGMSAITAITVQNTCAVRAVYPLPATLLEQQLATVCEDIPPDAIKIGMLGDAQQVPVIANCLKQYSDRPIVLDPVLRASVGTALSGAETARQMQEMLFPLVTLLTPNLPEAEELTGMVLHTREEREKAAKALFQRYGCAVLLKGGHAAENADDLLCDAAGIQWYPAPRICNPNTHGTGCTLSSAIAAYLALGRPLRESVQAAKEYLTKAIAAGLSLGHGNGPLRHFPLSNSDGLSERSIKA